MADLVPRNFWPIPRQSVASLLNEIDEVLTVPQVEMNPISLSEDDKHVHIEAALPGVDQEDIEITFGKGVLWIRGETKENEENKKRKFYRHATETFSYRIAIPGDIDPNATIGADYRNGVVKITLPKAVSSMPQKITVKRSKGNGEGEKRGSSEKKAE